MNLAVWKTKGQKTGNDLGVLSFLRKTIIRSTGCHRSDDPYGNERVLAHPEGYEVMPEVGGEEIAKANAENPAVAFTRTNNMAEAFKDADIVYPKSWAPFAAMEKRTDLYAEGDSEGIKALEKELLAWELQNTKTGAVLKN